MITYPCPTRNYGHVGVCGILVQRLLLSQDAPACLLKYQDSTEPRQLTFDHRRPGLVDSQDGHKFGPDFPTRRSVFHVLIQS